MDNWQGGLWKFGDRTRFIRDYLTNFAVLHLPHQKVGGALVSILSAMELPVATITVSVIVLKKESLTILQVCGIILVLFGMMLPSYFASRKSAND